MSFKVIAPLILAIFVAACSSPEEDSSDGGGLAMTAESSEAKDALSELTRAVKNPDTLATLQTFGSEDTPTLVMGIVSTDAKETDPKAKGLDLDTTKFVYSHGQTFAYYDPSTGGFAMIGNPETQESDLEAMKKDIGKNPDEEPAGGLTPQSFGGEVAESALRTVSGRVFDTMLTATRTVAAQGLKIPVGNTAELSSSTAKAIAEAVHHVPKWVARMAKTSVTGALKLENVDWAQVASKLSGLGTKTVYLGEDGAKSYLKTVANDRPIMAITHSGKLSDAKLADPVSGPALRRFVDRANQFMPDVLDLIAKKEGAKLMIGGGTMEGGQVVAYRAAAQKGMTVDSVMSGKGVSYVMDGQVAPSRNVVIEGADWGGESETATAAAAIGFVWGGGAQGLQEAQRLVAAGKPVYVIRESAALAGITIPNAGDDLAKLSAPNLHVFETWEEALSTLQAAVH